MKTNRILRVLCCFLILLPGLLPARGPGGGPGNGGGVRNPGTGSGPPAGTPAVHGKAVSGISSPSGLATLDQFLSLDDESLEQLEATIRRIRQMTPEQRLSLREQIAEYRQLPEEEKRTLQTSWGRLDRNVRKAWRDYMLSLEDGERETVREEMQSVPVEERTRWRMNRLIEKGFLEQESEDP